MAIRKRFLCALLMAVLFSGLAWAKSKKKSKTGFSDSPVVTETAAAEGEEGAEGEEEKDPDTGWQYLEWEEDYPEYVQKYEVVIEEKKDDKSGWNEINRFITEDNTTRVQIQPLLTPGFYRYKVITYDLIGIPEVESDWFEFNIYRAYIPQIRSVEAAVTHSSTIYLDEINDGIFTVNGRNLFELQENPTDISFTTYSVINARKNIVASLIPHITEFSDNNRHLKIQFDLEELDTGTYYFCAPDASGRASEHNQDSMFTIKFRKAVDFDVAVGYTCPVIVFGDRMMDYLNTSVLPLSANAKISLMPYKRRFGYLGFGIDAAYTRLLCKADGYDLDGNFITGNSLFIYQLPIRVKSKKDSTKLRHIATLELHGGGGLAMFNDTKFHFARDISSIPLNSLDFCVLAGASAHIYFTNRLYVEAGADFVMPFMDDVTMGYIKPVVAVGWQF